MLVIDTSVAVKRVVPETGRGLEADTDIALAIEHQAPLVTADMKFVMKCRASSPDFPVYALKDQNWS